MTEYSEMNACISRDGLTSVDSMLIYGVALTNEEIDDIFTKVRSLMGKEIANPIVACSGDFDLKSMIAGSIIITIMICAGMDVYEYKKIKARVLDDTYQNASHN